MSQETSGGDPGIPEWGGGERSPTGVELGAGETWCMYPPVGEGWEPDDDPVPEIRQGGLE